MKGKRRQTRLYQFLGCLGIGRKGLRIQEFSLPSHLFQSFTHLAAKLVRQPVRSTPIRLSIAQGKQRLGVFGVEQTLRSLKVDASLLSLVVLRLGQVFHGGGAAATIE